MTGYQHLVREHPTAPRIIVQEKAAWQAYAHHMTVRLNKNMNVVNHGDDESRRLFGIWRALRAERDGISNARHKRDNIRFRRGA